MKKLFVISLFTIVSAGMFFAKAAWAQEVGTYQLFQGKYNQLDTDSNTSTEKNDIFLLNTATGEIQIYVASISKGKQVNYWSSALVDENKMTITTTTQTG